jgi:hypothetical protein
MANLLAGLEVMETLLDGALFHDGEILPVQFHSASREAINGEPIRRLMTAILVDAVQCYRSGARRCVKGKGSRGGPPLDFRQICGVSLLVH